MNEEVVLTSTLHRCGSHGGLHRHQNRVFNISKMKIPSKNTIIEV